MDSAGIPDQSPPLNAFYFDCSQQICTAVCPQWCAFIFPPPPPLYGLDDSDGSGTFFSPLIVAVIGILASALVLVTYYAIVTRYCRRRVDNDDGGGGAVERFETDRAVSETRHGLDEALIKSISVYKFRKGEGLIEGMDCSVCLSEFQENESLRLLPKCSHAFHQLCIDTWLKSNSSCPNCRCDIASSNSPPPPQTSVTALGYRHRSNAAVVVVQDLTEIASLQAVVVEIATDSTNQDPNPNPNPNPSISDQSVHSIRLDSDYERSWPFPGRNLCVADVLSSNHEEDEEIEAVVDSSMAAGTGSSNGDGKESEKWRNSNGVMNSAMKMSISSGIFSFARNAKGKNSNLPN